VALPTLQFFVALSQIGHQLRFQFLEFLHLVADSHEFAFEKLTH
jgi:hypothetical protein